MRKTVAFIPKTTLYTPSNKVNSTNTDILPPSNKVSSTNTDILPPSNKENSTNTDILPPSNKVNSTNTDILPPDNIYVSPFTSVREYDREGSISYIPIVLARMTTGVGNGGLEFEKQYLTDVIAVKYAALC